MSWVRSRGGLFAVFDPTLLLALPCNSLYRLVDSSNPEQEHTIFKPEIKKSELCETLQEIIEAQRNSRSNLLEKVYEIIMPD